MLASSSLDWPLSREEKKHRLLQLYDSDLQATDKLLQSSRLHRVRPAEEHVGEYCTSASVPIVDIPGAVGEEGSTFQPASSSTSPSPPARSTPLAKQKPDEVPSSRGAHSARSFEYLTPESIPPTPPGFCEVVDSRVVRHQRPQRPLSAPSETPPPNAGKARCRRTDVLIPPVPPMPAEFLRCKHGDEIVLPIPPMPLPVLRDIKNIPKLPSDLKRVQNLRRPRSAAAAPGCGRSLTGEPNKHSRYCDEGLCNPAHVFSSARHGRFEEVEAALLAGFKANYADSHGNTLFHVACQNGKKRIAKLAVKHGAHMNAQNAKGNTGLHFLFAYGYPSIAEYFMEKGASEHISNAMGKAAREGIR